MNNIIQNGTYPKISVVTVCFNSEKTIERAVQSVMAQKYDNLEYIIIDGGSDDSTLEIIERYRDKISVVVSERDNGIYDAMNKGLDLATGDLIAFLNSDDKYNDGALRAAAKIYRETRADVLYGDITVVNGQEYKRQSLKNVNISDTVIRTTILHPGIFVSTNLMKEIRFDDRYKIASDYKALLRIYYRGVRYAYIDYNITFFYYGGISTTDDLNRILEDKTISEEVAKEEGKYSDELQKRIDNYFGYQKFMCVLKSKLSFSDNIIKECKKILSNRGYYIFGAGIRGRQTASFLNMLGIPIIAFLDNNEQGERMLDGVRVVSPSTNLLKTDNKIIITPKDAYEIIKEQLKDMGISDDRIIDYYQLASKVGSLFNIS